MTASAFLRGRTSELRESLPKAILFDLDGTLWDRTNAVRALATEQYEHLRDALGHIPQQRYVDRIIRLDDLGRVDKRVLYETIGVQFNLSSADVARLHADFWTRFASHTRPFPEVIHTLHRLREGGIKTGIISNGSTAVQEAKIRQLGLSALVDAVLISEREGIRKPDPKIFHLALGRLGAEASQAWFVGDNPDDDIAGALAVGLRTFWRECADWPRPTAQCETIRSLDELLSLVSEGSDRTLLDIP
jgi:putative hydrolase of the HAD superfamily